MNSGRADGPVLHSLVISQGESRIQDRLSPIQLTVVCSRQDSLKADVGPTISCVLQCFACAPNQLDVKVVFNSKYLPKGVIIFTFLLPSALRAQSALVLLLVTVLLHHTPQPTSTHSSPPSLSGIHSLIHCCAHSPHRCIPPSIHRSVGC